ncbi:hypothetical protein [Thalassospira sp.]|uniref:hypothetical protein n=1 Tax=Thalassospira sp. TaxID=1912094 RepID=UPI001B1F39A5|nr:hypothetical protein [Thalassospira sp.]MBO6809232.1 hypothetical protein [Thalassospira sp.]MBO6841191.1 hypothetical protein [Thalassospira sp.]
MKASQLDRSCSKNKLEERFGALEAQQDKQPSIGFHQAKAKHRYKPRPLIRHRSTPTLWQRYLNNRRILIHQPSLTARTLRNWKMFLLMEASQDPLAMTLIVAHKEMLKTFITQKKTANELFHRSNTK